MTCKMGCRWGSMALCRKSAGTARRAVLFCTTALAGAAIWVPALAADTNWTGATSGNWFTATNWDTGAVPVLGDNAIIDTTTPNAAVLGGGATGVSNLTVGNVATGTLTITSGGLLAYDGAIGYLGFGAGSSGTIAITGPGSTLTALHTLAVGYAGTGTLQVSNGAVVNASDGEVGQVAGSTGTATVDGAGSSWSNSNLLTVGDAGTGTLTISNGGSASGVNGGITIGASATGIGTVIVTGAGSTLSTNPALIVGDFGTGILTIENGATGAISGPITLGNNAGSSGTVTVTGAGSTLGTFSDLNVGNSGTGTLNVENGAAVTAFDANLGLFSGSSGTVTVAGAGSSLTTNSGLYIGYSGAGTMAISNGGTVTNSTGFVPIGYNSGASGTVTVDGAGSNFNTPSLYVGYLGAGTLTLSNGGTVTATDIHVAGFFGSTGTINIGAAVGQAPVAPGTIAASTIDFGLGTGGIVFNHTSSNYVFSVPVSGAGSLDVENGTTVLTAANSYRGGTTINGGVLRIAGAGTLGNTFSGMTTVAGGTLDLGGTTQTQDGGIVLRGGAIVNGTLSSFFVGFDLQSGTVSAALAGPVSLVKSGPGTVTLNGVNSYTHSTRVNGGILSVNGSIASSSLTTVNAGGTLGGTGIVGNTKINGGTLSPGNSIGTLTVQGSLVFTAASSYMVEVSPANADRTNVTGLATLGGATVNASFAGSFVARQYTILNAAGGFGGSRFNALVNSNLPAGFQSSLSYDANNAYLNFALAFGSPGGLNRNQQNVGNALSNFFNSSGGIALVFGALTPAGLTQASGETATGTQQTTFEAMNLFMGVMTDPFVAGRGDPVSPSTVAPQFTDENDGANAYAANGKPRSKSERDAYAAIYRKAPIADPFAQRWSVWAAGYGGSQTSDGNAALGSNTVTSRIAGAAVGADYRFSPFTMAGFALAGGGTNFSIANALGTGRSDLFQAGAFIRHTVGPAYISAALAYGWQDITTDRTVTIAGVDRLRAEFNANAFSGRVDGGYRFVTPWVVGITPYAAGQFTTFELPAYAEQVLSGANTFALAYGSKSVTASRSELGLRTDKSWAMQNAILTLRGRFAWAHDFNPDRNIAATFQTLPGASFVVNGAAQAHDAALTTASAEMKWLNGWSAAATFEGEFSGVTRSYAGKGVVRYAW
jgi:T5SS/PEP-CTERM-associated repeat protein/autotransporter-associated beta strand protein